jgi:hypothetical protein
VPKGDIEPGDHLIGQDLRQRMPSAFAALRLMTKPLVQQRSPGVIFRLKVLRFLTRALQSIREPRQRVAVQTRE